MNSFWNEARDLHVGDLGKGVPELKADSRYNQDVDMITSHFAIGVDLLQVIAEAKAESEEDSPCVNRDVMDRIARYRPPPKPAPPPAKPK